MKKDNKSDKSKEAKMNVLKELRQMAMDAMSGSMGDLKKVTVAAKDEEGLEKGLSTAKEMIKKKLTKED